MKWTPKVAILLLILLAGTSGAEAGLLFVGGGDSSGVGVGFDFPIYKEQSSFETASGQVQVVTDYKGGKPCTWDQAADGYLGILPAGIGMTMTIYPNVISNLPVATVAVVQGELERKLEFKKEKGVWLSKTPGVTMCTRNADGRFSTTILLDQKAGTDAHCLRFYALIEDAKRDDKKLDLLLVQIKWATRKDVTQMVDTLRFKTELWPANCAEPSLEYVTDLCRRAGNGGNGLVFETLIANDIARQTAGSTPQRTERSVTRGTYFIRPVKAGKAYMGQTWYRFFDKQNPNGKSVGPFCGTITLSDSELSETCDGVTKTFEPRVDYSCDGQNWLSRTYVPTLGCTIDLSL